MLRASRHPRPTGRFSSLVSLVFGALLLAQLQGCTSVRTHLPEAVGGISEDCAACRKACGTADSVANCRTACSTGACRKE